jgi:hypothetical protein
LGPNGLLAGPNASVTLNANTQWLASARAKLGFTGWFNNTMLYVTGGGAWANIEYNATFITTPPLNLANPSQTTTQSGWVIGGWVDGDAEHPLEGWVPVLRNWQQQQLVRCGFPNPGPTAGRCQLGQRKHSGLPGRWKLQVLAAKPGRQIRLSSRLSGGPFHFMLPPI